MQQHVSLHTFAFQSSSTEEEPTVSQLFPNILAPSQTSSCSHVSVWLMCKIVFGRSCQFEQTNESLNAFTTAYTCGWEKRFQTVGPRPNIQIFCMQLDSQQTKSNVDLSEVNSILENKAEMQTMHNLLKCTVHLYNR